MKKVFGTIAILAFAIPLAAQAADLPAAAPAYKTPVVAPPPAYTWTGCYIGAHAGGAWSSLNVTDVGNGVIPFDTFAAGQTFSTNNNTSFFGGGQVGCNYQAGWFVGGIEGGVGWMDLNRSVVEPGAFNNTAIGINSGLYGDITARLGAAFGPALFYAKGGWAWYNGSETFTTTSVNFVSNTDLSTFSGWVAGGGIEYQFAPNWTAKLEYLHYAFNSQTFNVTAVGAFAGNYPFTIQPTVDTVKVGVNYLFNWGGPVVARY